MKLHTLIARYVAFRKSLGERFHTNEGILESFSRALGSRVEIDDVRADQVSAFLAGRGPLTSSWHVKHNALLGFYRYALSRGYAQHSPLPVAIPKRPQPFVPYIYTRKELHQLLASTLTYQKHRGRLDPFVVRMMLLFLYGTGLRLGEALALTLADLDLAQTLVTVRESKFFKTRLVPLGPQLAKASLRYLMHRKEVGYSQDGSSPFFPGRTGKPINRNTFENIFRRIRQQAGIHRAGGERCQPRIHDLRHTFAVHRLVAWYQEGVEVQRWLPQLSVYLGHAHLAATSTYLSMTPDLLAQASERFEQHALKGGAHD